MIDYLVIGGGLAGSILTDVLSQQANVLLLDANTGKHSSQVAAGIFNPVTGRRMTKSWMVDTIGPHALEYYRNHERNGNVALVQEKVIKRLFHNPQQRQEWLDRVEFQNLEGIINGQISPDENHPLYKMDDGGVETGFSWRLDTIAFLRYIHQQFEKEQLLVKELIDAHQLKIENGRVALGDYEAKNVVFAEGYLMTQNPYFSYLPMRPNKGELLIIECDDLDEEQLVQKRIFVLPIGGNRYKIGATYKRDDLTLETSEWASDWLLERLDKTLKVPYTIVGQESGIRPAVRDRRPLIGHHPEHQNVWVFNGFGSKGVSQIPWCAEHFAGHLAKSEPLFPELDVRRFDKLPTDY